LYLFYLTLKNKLNLGKSRKNVKKNLKVVIIMAYINSVFHGDCMELLKQIPDNSIDMVFTDPPYFLNNLDSNWSTDNLKAKSSNSHIKTLPMGMKFDRKQSYEFQKFMDKVMKELFRVLKPGGFCLSFSSPRLYHRLAVSMEDSGFELRDMIGWVYTKSQVKAFGQNHIIENDKVMTDPQKKELKEKLKSHRTPQLKPSFEPIGVGMKPIEGRFIDNMRKYKTGLMDCSNYVGNENDRFPTNVMSTNEIDENMDKYFFVPKASKQEKLDNSHPTVKPVNLCEHLIKLFCPEDGTVLDPFSGSGTTLVAAMNNSRHFIGSELNDGYIKIANKRLGI
jgi:site-specific DNA-methyltransferase (adenine-specific)